MATALILSLVLQQLAVVPFPCEEGAPAVVVCSTPDGLVVGQTLTVEFASGVHQQLGVTDATGAVRFRAPVAGLHTITTDLGGVRVVTPLRVVPVPSRWLYALICGPLGVVLFWRALRPAPARAPKS